MVDDNYSYVLMGQDELTGEAKPVLLDEEGRILGLLVYSDYEPEPRTDIAVDENYNYCGLAETADSGGTTPITTGTPIPISSMVFTYSTDQTGIADTVGGEIRPLLIDPTNNYILVDTNKENDPDNPWAKVPVPIGVLPITYV